MEARTKKSIYEDLYAYYNKLKDYKLALFVKKYFLEGIKDTSALKEHL
jgi:hypothetical protein|nr:MAG TPA: hypothetical protein [Bacteriophage sp.]